MNEKDIETLKEIVYKELDACGYFLVNHQKKSFGELLLIFACQYNMEFENRNFNYVENHE